MPRRRSGWGYYGGYGDYSSSPLPVTDGIKAKSERGSIGESWWSKRWVDVLESFEMGNRLSRGRSYARKGQVLSIEIEKGKVTAKVQGSRPTPYKIAIKLALLKDREWDLVVNAMAEQAIFAAKLLSGEMPKDIEEAFSAAGVSLFPKSLTDMGTDCSCPDWSNPCKHLAAVYYILAERFDEDPFLIFTLRGRTKTEIIQALREKRANALPDAEEEVLPQVSAGVAEPEAPPLAESLANFWQMGEGLEDFSARIEPPEIQAALLKRLGTPPFADNTPDFETTLLRSYIAVTLAALEKAGS